MPKDCALLFASCWTPAYILATRSLGFPRLPLNHRRMQGWASLWMCHDLSQTCTSVRYFHKKVLKKPSHTCRSVQQNFIKKVFKKWFVPYLYKCSILYLKKLKKNITRNTSTRPKPVEVFNTLLKKLKKKYYKKYIDPSQTCSRSVQYFIKKVEKKLQKIHRPVPNL